MITADLLSCHRCPAISVIVCHQANIDERKATYAKVQEILAEEVPFAPQAGTYQGNLKRKQLQGVKTNGYTTSQSWNAYEWSWA